MTKAERQLFIQGFHRSVPATLGAGLLIFFGTVFQLCELGWIKSGVGNLWPVSVVMGNLCSAIEVCLKTPLIDEALRFWPLVLVFIGCSMLTAPRAAASQPSRGGDEFGR